MSPAKIDKCVKDVKKQGKSESSAWAICNAALGKKKKKKPKKRRGK